MDGPQTTPVAAETEYKASKEIELDTETTDYKPGANGPAASEPVVNGVYIETKTPIAIRVAPTSVAL